MTESQAAVIIVLLFGIFICVVAVAAVVFLRRQPQQPQIALEIREAVQELNIAVQSHVRLNAVMALIDQFVERPELMANLVEYSRQEVAAALLQRLNQLGADLEKAQERLSHYEKQYAASNAWKSEMERAQRWVERTNAALMAT